MLPFNRYALALPSLLLFTSLAQSAPGVSHSHAGRIHSHALPKAQQLSHRHGQGAPGSAIAATRPTNSLDQYYARLSTQQKQRIQEALAWVIGSPTPLDTPFNQTSHKAIKQWQQSAGLVSDGRLTPPQISRLEAQASTAKRAVNWTIYRSAKDRFQIGIPNRFAQRKSFNEAGGVEFSSFSSGYTLSLLASNEDEIDSFLSGGSTSLQSMYQQMLQQFKAEGLGNIRQRRDQEGFMLSGVQNGEILYVNFTKKANGHAGYMLSLPYTQSTRSGSNTLLAATALSFKVDKEVQPNVEGRVLAKTLNKRAVAPVFRNRSSAALSAEAIFRKVSKSVWLLRPANSRMGAQGSAVAINRHYLLTNCHVMGRSTSGNILNSEASKSPIQVSLYAKDKANDRCVLKSRTPLPNAVSIRPYRNINVGEKVYTIGAPQGLSLTIAEGLLSSKREVGKRRLLQTSAPISQGSSGGGLFDTNGNLLGITTLMSMRGQNLNFAIPAEEFWAP